MKITYHKPTKSIWLSLQRRCGVRLYEKEIIQLKQFLESHHSPSVESQYSEKQKGQASRRQVDKAYSNLCYGSKEARK